MPKNKRGLPLINLNKDMRVGIKINRNALSGNGRYT